MSSTQTQVMRLFDRINAGAAWLARWAVLLMLAIGIWNVIGRYLGSAIGINLSPEWWEGCSFKEELLHAIKSGDVWLNKVKHDEDGKRIRGNVCLEVYLPSRGTCLLQHVNLGACEFSIKAVVISPFTNLA